MVAALIVGPTVLILNMLTSSTGSLLNTFLFNSFDTAALNPQKREWMSSWTLYYWGWWLSWRFTHSLECLLHEFQKDVQLESSFLVSC